MGSVTISPELRAVHGRREALQAQKRRVIDIYATGDLSRDGYVEKNRELDGIAETLDARRRELEDHAALLQKSGEIDAGISEWCEAARMRFNRCRDAADTRQFLLHHVEKVVHFKDKVSLHGSIPIKQGFGADAEVHKLAFCIESEISPEERYTERMRTAKEMRYQQSVAALHQESADQLPAKSNIA
jgi:hypothetical protein